MEKQQIMWIGGAIIVIIIAALLWSAYGPSKELGEPLTLTTEDIDIQGQIISVNESEDTFVVKELRVGDKESFTPLEETQYTITWNNGTQFYLFESPEQVAAGTPKVVGRGEMKKDGAVMVDTQESEGETRTAARVFLLSENLQPQAE